MPRCGALLSERASLPLYPAMNENDVQRVAEAVKPLR